MGPIKKTAAAEGELVRMLPVDQLLASPTNPRRKLGDLTELAESIRAKGVLQPILARTLQPVRTPGPGDEPEQWQIVFGHRRWAGAKKAGLTEIPALVKAMTDREVLEAQLIENSQREDMEPLDEADGFKALHETHGCSVGELAAKIGKSEGYVYGRLKLCGLVAEAREKLQDGAFSVAVALLVARLPRVEQQRAAVKKLEEAVRYQPEGYKVTIESAEDALEEFHLELRDAPFPLELADLVDGAGACGPCPKRSNNQPQLFAGVSPADVCTDAACFSDKRKAWLARQKAEAEAKGLTVLKAGEARKALGFGSPLVQLDAVVQHGAKDMTVRALVGKKHGLEVKLAPTDDGKLVEVVDRKEVNAALKKAGSTARVPTPSTANYNTAGGNNDWQAQQKKRQEREKELEPLAAIAVGLIIAAAEKKPEKVWPRLVDGALINGDGKETADRRGTNEKALVSSVKSMTDAQRLGLLLELELRMGGLVDSYRGTWSEGLKDAAADFGVDLKKIESDAKQAAKAAAKEVKDKGACAIPGCNNPIKRDGFCASHGAKLSGTEQKSILARNKRLAAEGKLPGRVTKVSGKAGADAR